MDSGAPLREFRAQGAKTFFRTVDAHHDRQYCLGMEAVDTRGGRALASASSTSAGRHWFGNCSDNVNIMEGGTYGPTDRVPKGYECYFPRWGVWLWPDLRIADAQPLNLPHDERLRFASTDCTIVDHLFRVTHKPDVLPVGGGRMMRPLHPLRDFEARQRRIFFTPGVDTPKFTLYEPRVTLKRDVTVRGGLPNLRLLYAGHGVPMAKGDFAFATVTTDNGQTLVEQTPRANAWPRTSHRGTLPKGGYMGVFPNYTGVGAVFALEPDTQFAIEGNAKSRRLQVGKHVKPGTVLKAGTVLTTRVLSMEGRWRQRAGNTEIEQARTLFGLAGGPPGYKVHPSVGKVSDTCYTCTLATDKGAFRARFHRAPLPVDLPIVVEGLSARWDAGVWVKGSARGVRHFGQFEGKGYTTLRLNQGPVDAFIGHPVVCDAPQVWLSLVEADKTHLRVVVHNPTDKPVRTHVRKSAGFDLGPALDKTVTVPAGSSAVVSAR